MSEEHTERLLRLVEGEFAVRRGHPLPLGATPRRDGVNFAVFSRHATAVTLVLFVPGETDPTLEIPLDPRYNRTGDVWHALIAGIGPGVEYAYRADRSPNFESRIHRFDPTSLLLDPYGTGVAGLEAVGRGRRLPALRTPGLPAVARRRRGVRLGPRAAPQHPAPRHRHLRGPRARLHAQPHVGGGPPRHVPRPGGEDPVPEGPGRHGRRAHAHHRVRGVRQPPPRAGNRGTPQELLGIPARLVLRPEGVLCQGRRIGRSGPGVQGHREGLSTRRGSR